MVIPSCQQIDHTLSSTQGSGRRLQKLGEDFYHDSIEDYDNDEAENDVAVAQDGAVAQADEQGNESELSDSSIECEEEIPAADEHGGRAQSKMPPACDDSDTKDVTLSEDHAVAVHAHACSIEALEESLKSMRQIGKMGTAQAIELELRKERRRMRQLTTQAPTVADAFMQRRRAEEQRIFERKRLLDEMNEREHRVAEAKAAEKAAVARLKKARMEMNDLENARAERHAMKTYTLEVLGDGKANGGGAKSKTKRMEVLDRLARRNDGLSQAQRNDWSWFKDAWDLAMLNEHKENWPKIFAGWMKTLCDQLEDRSSNAFSVFVHSETTRVFNETAALQVPGN